LHLRWERLRDYHIPAVAEPGAVMVRKQESRLAAAP
jgi:hypothetical protein